MNTTTRSREFREGWRGRRRIYSCRECRVSFQIDTLNPLPEIDRVCPECKQNTTVYTFTDKSSGKDVQVRASNVELATLRAWKINAFLTFKIPQPTQGVDNG